MEELGANVGDRMGTVGQEGLLSHRQETLIPPLNTSGSCGVEPPVYAHHSLNRHGVGSHHHHHLLPPQWASRSLHLLHHPRGTQPCARQEGSSSSWSAGCVNPIRNSISRLPVAKGSALPAQAARGEGGIGAAGLT